MKTLTIILSVLLLGACKEINIKKKQVAYYTGYGLHTGYLFQTSIDTTIEEVKIDSFDCKVVYNEHCNKYAVKLFDYPCRYNKKTGFLYDDIEDNYYGARSWWWSEDWDKYNKSEKMIKSYYLGKHLNTDSSMPVLAGKGEFQFSTKDSAISALNKYLSFQQFITNNKRVEAVRLKRAKEVQDSTIMVKIIADSIANLCHQYK